MGGGFGGKETQAGHVAVWAAVAAQAVRAATDGHTALMHSTAFCINPTLYRGAGYTLASGSSSSASAAVAHRLGLVDRDVTVHMPGGTIGIEIGDGFSIMMTGTVNKVAEGVMHPELFAVKV